ncbi:MAG: NAD(P)/FAD-dependent oxidoreductase [Candidatus Saganbacteria bacterium]|nr:NAD(P)/FAD-dependent oxidoreductase [Candidatus Saganbacteria bacterium]
MEKIKYSIIGAGVIGLAVAYALSQDQNGEIAVFEKNDTFGQETSSRNSEVIHAGIYYVKDSLKSRLCMDGNKLLYEFCEKNAVKHKKCGKLIVATDGEEVKKIEKIYANAVSMGVPGLKLIGQDEIKKYEPEVSALGAVYSKTTGIIDSHGLMQKLYDLAKKNRVMFSFKNEVIGIRKEKNGYVIKPLQGDEVLSEFVINCAGLAGDKTAETAGFDIDKLGYRLHYCKGDYFAVPGANGRLSHLVYPPPHDKGYGLGVHATIDLSGRIRLGPDTTYVDSIGYDIDPAKAIDFFSSAKKFLPWLEEKMVVPDTSGMRPKLQGPDDGIRDFVVKEESDNGFPGFINLIGIESPGLTSCPAIANLVSNLTGK